VNSRSAANEAKANSSTTPIRPASSARPTAMQIAHHALTRELRLSMAPWGWRFATAILSPSPMTDATPGRARCPSSGRMVCGCVNNPVGMAM
jgi:hypothetical protein